MICRRSKLLNKKANVTAARLNTNADQDVSYAAPGKGDPPALPVKGRLGQVVHRVSVEVGWEDRVLVDHRDLLELQVQLGVLAHREPVVRQAHQDLPVAPDRWGSAAPQVTREVQAHQERADLLDRQV